MPCIPGGAGVAIKATRAVGALANIAGGVLSVQDGLENGNYIEAGLGAVQVISVAGQLSNVLSTGSKVSEAAKRTSPKSNHDNNLSTTKTAQGYILKEKNTGDVLKYGEATRGEKRYTKKYLNEHNAYMDFNAKGSKKEMHD